MRNEMIGWTDQISQILPVWEGGFLDMRRYRAMSIFIALDGNRWREVEDPSTGRFMSAYLDIDMNLPEEILTWIKYIYPARWGEKY